MLVPGISRRLMIAGAGWALAASMIGSVRAGERLAVPFRAMPGDRFTVEVLSTRDGAGDGGTIRSEARYDGVVAVVAPRGMVLTWTPAGRVDPPLPGQWSGALGLLGRPITFLADPQGRPVEIEGGDDWLARVEAAAAAAGTPPAHRPALDLAAGILRDQRRVAAALLLGEANLIGRGQAFDLEIGRPEVRRVELPASRDQWKIDVEFTTRVLDATGGSARVEVVGPYRPARVTGRMLERMGLDPRLGDDESTMMIVFERTLFTLDLATGWAREVDVDRDVRIAEADGERRIRNRQTITVRRRGA